MSTTPQGLNADQRAKEREDADYVIGGKTFHRLRLTNPRFRVVRALGREQTRHNRDEIKVLELIDAITSDAPEDEIKRLQDLAGTTILDVDQLQAEADEHEDAAIELSYKIIAEHLVDDDGQAPAVEFLEEHLDQPDLVALRRMFQGLPVDPPSTPTSASAST